MYIKLEQLYKQKIILDHGLEVGKQLAFVLSGGNTHKDQELSEDDMYALELEAFMNLIQMAKTQERIKHTLETGKPLPENIQKVVDFINETGGSLQDYVKLNTDYDALNEDQLLAEYYQTSKPHLNIEEVNFLRGSLMSNVESHREQRAPLLHAISL